MKKVVVERFERKFVCEVTSELGGAMCGVTIWEEVRPNWKIFKNRYCCSKSFWVHDYEEIMSGVCQMVDSYLDDEGFDMANYYKWKEFRDC